MNQSLWWILLGVAVSALAWGAAWLARGWYRRWRYGIPIAHEELLVAYAREMANFLDRRDVGRLLAHDAAGAIGVSRALVLLPEGHDLRVVEDGDLQLPGHHAAVRWVAAAGEAMPVSGRLRELIAQGRADLAWTAAWVPLMRGADLQGVWLLGQRAGGRAYAPEDLRWLTALARQAALVLEAIRHAEQRQSAAQELQTLYRQAVLARESEREHLARELHDSVLQDLCAVIRDLKATEAGSSERAPLTDLATRAGETVQTLRAICHNLRPPLLANNLALALRALVERLDASSPAPVHIEITAADLSLPEETALAIYRIVQEALHNALQHADPSEVAVRLTQYPDRLRISVVDDGQGIPGGVDLARFVSQGHFGLAGMRERAEMIGGNLDIQSAKDYGTVVILEIPWAG